MLRKVMSILIVSLFVVSLSKAEDTKLTTFQDSVAYGIGVQIGNNLKNDSLMLDVDILKQGIFDALYKSEVMLSDQQIGTIMTKFQQQLQQKQQMAMQQVANKNLKKAEEFLAQNKTNDGIKVTESGLQYEVIEAGSGVSPAATDTVEVHYEGKLLDGSVFDSSYDRGETIEFPLDRVIPGWTEGVQLMKVGAKYKFYIHPKLGYGQRGAGENIGPNELLIFTVELINVK